MERSLPAWKCGLKYDEKGWCSYCEVTSCVEVWIEIEVNKAKTAQENVTSCVEVWIEIYVEQNALVSSLSLPAWKCGLKYHSRLELIAICCHFLRGSVD